MAKGKNTKAGIEESVPAVEAQESQEVPVEETVDDPEDQHNPDGAVEAQEGQEVPVEETVDGSEDQQDPDGAVEAQEGQGTSTVEFPAEIIFRITCRNKISKTIGGVKFVDGVGYTRDGYSASWFANKEGYAVRRDKGIEL